MISPVNVFRFRLIIHEGENEKLGLKVMEYRRPVKCEKPPTTPPPDDESCQWIFKKMPVGGATTVFGRRDSPYADPRYRLPFRIAKRKWRVPLTITVGPLLTAGQRAKKNVC